MRKLLANHLLRLETIDNKVMPQNWNLPSQNFGFNLTGTTN